MALPTVGGSDGTWGTELNTHLNVSIASDGKIKDGAVMESSDAPIDDAGVVNKKYVDDKDSSTNLVKAYGQVEANGTLSGGLNVSTSRDSLGVYTLTFDTDFANKNYACVATVGETQGRMAMFTDKQVGYCKVTIRTDANALADHGFDFIAVGVQ